LFGGDVGKIHQIGYHQINEIPPNIEILQMTTDLDH